MSTNKLSIRAERTLVPGNNHVRDEFTFDAEDSNGVDCTELNQFLHAFFGLPEPKRINTFVAEPPRPKENHYRIVTVQGIHGFAWPRWLKAQYIAMDESCSWYCYETQPNQNPKYWTWSNPNDLSVLLEPKLLDLNFPPIDSSLWKETLTKNPWNGQEESST